MNLTYQKLGTDHPMYGQVDYLVVDGQQAICYKTQDGYQPLENNASASNASTQAAELETKPLYVLSFKVNDEAEEMTFNSKKKLDKVQAKLAAKGFVTDFNITTYQVVA